MAYEIRAMGLGEILDTGFRLLRNHFVLLIGISAVVYVPAGAFGVLVEDFLQDPSAATSGTDATLVLLPFLGLLVTFAIISPITSCAITHALGELYLGREVTLGQSFRTALSLFLPLVGTSLLATMIVLVGLLLLVVPGVYLVFAFLLLTQVIVLERVYGMPALARSRELMRGHMLRGLAVLLVAGLLAGVLGVALGLAFAAIPSIEFLGSSLAQALSFAYSSAVLVVLYFDIRARKEAFDLEHLARLVEGAGGAPRTGA